MLRGHQVAILGFGTMGQALARGLLAGAGLDAAHLSATVRSPDAAQVLASEHRIRVGTSNSAALEQASVALLCVKPQGALELVAELATAGALAHDPLLVSIVAGVSTRELEQAAAGRARVVRAMPNTPCRIGQGMSVVSRGARASEEDLALAEALLAPLGRVLRLDESHMNAVTGLSASGPAFVYLILEALAEGGVMVGLPRTVATELAAQTVQGAARMVLETGRHPAELKDEVTTPAGCTISALLSLEDGRLRSVLARGVQEATRAAALLGHEDPQQT